MKSLIIKMSELGKKVIWKSGDEKVGLVKETYVLEDISSDSIEESEDLSIQRGLITVKEASDVLNVSEARIRKLCKDKKVKCYKSNSRWLLDRNSIFEYLQEVEDVMNEESPVKFEEMRNQPEYKDQPREEDISSISVKRASEILNLSEGTIRKWCQVKKLKSKKVNRKWMIDKNDLFEHLNKLDTSV